MGTSGTNEDRVVVVESTADKATEFAAELVRSIICDAAAQRGQCTVALAGGTTPYLLYQKLASPKAVNELPWCNVDLFFGDERDVPQDHVESNYDMTQRTLLDHVPIDPARVHPMRADAPDIQRAAAEYEQLVRAVVPAVNGLPCFDLILLGMGGDGHTASLFPCTPDALNESAKLVLGHFVPVLGRKRMSMTFPLINAARNVILLVTGEDKARAVADLLAADCPARADLPAARIHPTAGKLTLVTDAGAARLTQYRPV